MDDETLAARLARDLDGWFEALVASHQDRLYSIALRLLGDPRDAEEVALDALVRAYRAIEGYEASRVRQLRLRPWLAAIAVNLARNRATRRRSPPSTPIDDHPNRLVAVAPSDIPHEAAARRESAAYWSGLLAGLPDRYRTAVVLRHVDGLSFGEIAGVLERPEGTVKAQVHRGLALLRAAHEATERAGAAPHTQPREMTA